MSMGLTIHCKKGELKNTVYCQDIADAFFFETFTILQAEAVSNFADYVSDGEGDWGTEIAKLPDPSKPTPEQIAEIEAKLSNYSPAGEVLAEAEKALAAIREMDGSELESNQVAVIADFEDLIVALREAEKFGYEVSLVIA